MKKKNSKPFEIKTDYHEFMIENMIPTNIKKFSLNGGSYIMWSKSEFDDPKAFIRTGISQSKLQKPAIISKGTQRNQHNYIFAFHKSLYERRGYYQPIPHCQFHFDI